MPKTGEPKLVRLNINEVDHDVVVEPRWTLSYVLRERLGLTGTKQACGNGECGNCTVLIDGKPVLSCLTLAIESAGKKILTIEGLAKGDKLHPIQQAFVDKHAIACGHCTPAMILTAYALLQSRRSPTEEEVKRAISGVLCRCTGYVKINDAILAAAETMRKGDKNA
ncbi:MAG: (2Fe-2S)-binding protein [Dehalococcoidia bacterium]|nr:(2Fe-2S)-binding protein [Dehalococcoidia bacterium]